jgi:hypothetical protein
MRRFFTGLGLLALVLFAVGDVLAVVVAFQRWGPLWGVIAIVIPPVAWFGVVGTTMYNPLSLVSVICLLGAGGLCWVMNRLERRQRSSTLD